MILSHSNEFKQQKVNSFALERTCDDALMFGVSLIESIVKLEQCDLFLYEIYLVEKMKEVHIQTVLVTKFLWLNY